MSAPIILYLLGYTGDDDPKLILSICAGADMKDWYWLKSDQNPIISVPCCVLSTSALLVKISRAKFSCLQCYFVQIQHYLAMHY